MTKLDKQTFGPWAFVTGASSGIGKEFARQLAANGFYLVMAARRVSELETYGAELKKKYGIEFRVVGVDFEREDYMSTIETATAGLDLGLLVSSAGTIAYGEFLDIDREALDRNLRMNVSSHLRLVHFFGRRLAQRRRGGMIVLSSMAGLQGTPYMLDYSAAKSYLISLGEGLNFEFKKSGVHFTVVAPGPVDTPMFANSGTSPEDTPMKPMSAEQCVDEALTAFRANKATFVPGRLNRAMLALMPRSIRPRMMGKMVEKGFERNKERAKRS